MPTESTDDAPLRPLITLDEAARRLGLDQVALRPSRVILDMVRRGELRGVRVSRWTMIDPESLDRYRGN
jgi:hypothetical protein